MAPSLGQIVRIFVVVRRLIFFVAVLCCSGLPGLQAAFAAPFAAYVMDARTGQTLYSQNADTRLHPASLTKMMTLYITFQEIERGRISLDTMVTVSKNAASQPPSRLGLKPGQKIAVRYLIRAAAVKSANDAASALGDFIGGNEANFAARMTKTARALGMKNSTFKNANGLTTPGHLSTAHDMSILGRRLFYDFPQYYNIFSRRTVDAGVAKVASTNRRFLDAYPGADGIKTGYTVAAGFNLVASAERDNKRIIAAVFGGASTAQRNQKIAELLNMGFKNAPARARINPPPVISNPANDLLADNVAPQVNAPADSDRPQAAAVAAAVAAAGNSMQSSLRPQARPHPAKAATAVAVAAMQDDIAGALAEATAPAKPVALAQQDAGISSSGSKPRPSARPERQTAAITPESPPLRQTAVAAADAASENTAAIAQAETPFATASAETMALAEVGPSRNAPIFDSAETKDRSRESEVVTRISTSGGRHYGINVGRFNTRTGAESALTKTLLAESATLNGALRKVVAGNRGFEANFLGLSRDQADLACARLQARSIQCFAIGD
jgi:D-alanyl-D-alanine carboxypeptidase